MYLMQGCAHEIVDKVLTRKYVELNLQNINGMTALMFGIKSKNYAILSLLNSPKIEVSLVDNNRRFAMMFLVQDSLVSFLDIIIFCKYYVEVKKVVKFKSVKLNVWFTHPEKVKEIAKEIENNLFIILDNFPTLGMVSKFKKKVKDITKTRSIKQIYDSETTKSKERLTSLFTNGYGNEETIKFENNLFSRMSSHVDC
jgi:hypothetical protein